jgi:uncharacterized integral membrane protein (TIGR00698 family)
MPLRLWLFISSRQMSNPKKRASKMSFFSSFNMSHLPPFCLFLGLVWGLIFGNPISAKTSKIGKYFLQFSVMFLGFTIPIDKVMQAGKEGILLSIVTIFGTLLVGALLGKLFKLPSNVATLVSFGTAICGGSAIAAASPIIQADPDEVAASLATVFILNAVALFLFPKLGVYFHFDSVSFGTWVGVAIHDTSSVVGAALSFNPESLTTATTVKLARALWIVPICIGLSWWQSRRVSAAEGQMRTSWVKMIPWFIPAFLLASVLRAFVHLPRIYEFLGLVSKVGLSVSLLCIGAGVSKKVFLKAGSGALGLGVVLWALVSVGSFLAIKGF